MDGCTESQLDLASGRLVLSVPDKLSKLTAQKIAKVHVRGRPRSQSGWIAYHESQDPLSLVERSRYVGYNSKSPSVSFVNRYDWGYHMPDLGNIPRTWADIVPDSGWKALLEREHRRKRVHKVICSSAMEDLGANHPDAARAKRREYYQSNKIFLLDADKAPGLVKFLARSVAGYQMKSLLNDPQTEYHGRRKLGQASRWYLEGTFVVFSFLGGTRDELRVLLRM